MRKRPVEQVLPSEAVAAADAAFAAPPTIQLQFDEEAMANAVIPLLAAHPDVFQRGGQLVHVVREPSPGKTVVRPDGAPRIAAMPSARLREILSSVAQFTTFRRPSEGQPPETRRTSVPGAVVSAVAARGQWSCVRPLVAITQGPFLRPNGSVVAEPGYDPATGTLYVSGARFPAFPPNPTREQAVQAADELLNVVIDFPFASGAHRAAWLSIVLTLVGRSAMSGCVPLALIDANTRGSGKTLLAEVAGLIATGQTLPRMAPVREDEEQRKRITTIALNGDLAVLLDNVAGTLGSPALDAALTSVEWSDRLLGGNTSVRVVLRTIWLATGNNVSLAGDLARRTLHVRLESSEENPEARTKFRHANLLSFVRQHRPRLFVAALTVLRAYFAAGRPDQHLKPWGSFEEWTRLVRGAIVWVGLPDPAETRVELANAADRDRDVLERLLTGLEAAGLAEQAMTAGELLRAMASADPAYTALRDAVAEGCGTAIDKLPDARRFGALLRRYRGRVLAGRALDHGTKTAGGRPWRLLTATPSGSDSGDSGDERWRSLVTVPRHEGTPGPARESPESLVTPSDLDEREAIAEFGGG